MQLHAAEMKEFPHTSRLASVPDAGPDQPPRVLNPQASNSTFDAIVHGVVAHFRYRITSWIAAYIILGMGLVMFDVPNLFTVDPASHSYAYLGRIMPQASWAMLCVILGVYRFGALIINGTFPSFPWCPQLRFVGSFLSMFFWFNLAFGPIASMKITFALPLYSGLFLMEVYNVYVAAHEAGV
jgi:hypothetical protein